MSTDPVRSSLGKLLAELIVISNICWLLLAFSGETTETSCIAWKSSISRPPTKNDSEINHPTPLLSMSLVALCGFDFVTNKPPGQGTIDLVSVNNSALH